MSAHSTPPEFWDYVAKQLAGDKPIDIDPNDPRLLAIKTLEPHLRHKIKWVHLRRGSILWCKDCDERIQRQ